MKIEQLHHLFLKSKGVATDTRGIQSNQLFFALKGDNFNGNSFAIQAINKGAVYAIVDEECGENKKYIRVANVLETLQQLATYHRNYLNIPILAITGSNGKTTTKELIHAVLRKKFNTAATRGNLNNHIGVPLTLLSMNTETEFGIVEMGANHPKEIASLCEIAQPDYGYITNFGKAHLEGFGSIEGVIKAKSELYNYLMLHEKTLFLNTDDPLQQKQARYLKTYSFGSAKTANVTVDYLENNQTAKVTASGIAYKSSLYGTYNAINIAAAICVGTYFRVSEERMLTAIASYIPNNNRSQIVKLGKATFLMDAYNANPTSMQASLESFHKSPAKEKVVILGDMFELGTTSAEEHQHIVSLLENLNFNRTFLIGSNFYKTETSQASIKKIENFQEFVEAVKETDFGSSHILVKGSRGMALERILEVFKDKEKYSR